MFKQIYRSSKTVCVKSEYDFRISELPVGGADYNY